MRRPVSFGFGPSTLVAALCVAGLLRMFASRASASDHLYVVTIHGSHYASVLSRYPLMASGLPMQKPDLTIPEAGPGIAVAADGTLAAFRPRTHQVNFFAPGATQPERTLILPAHQGCPGVVVISMTFDAHSDFFVAFAGKGESCNAGGTLAYAPGASGKAKPLASLPNFGALAVDTSGNLYLNPSGTTFVYSNPTSNPTLILTITGVQTLGGGIALVPPPYPRLWQYIMNAYSPNVLGQYYANEQGPQIPVNSIYTSTVDIAETGFVAYWKNLLYGTFQSPTGYGLNVFKEAGCCLETPLATLAAPPLGFRDLAVGP